MSSRSPQGSRSPSHSSSHESVNSLELHPARVPPPEHPTSGKEEPRSGGAAASSIEERETVSLFIGLGPSARMVRQEELEEYLKSHATAAECISEVRLRGRCAFADVASQSEADHLIHVLDGKLFKDRIRLTVQISLNKKNEDTVNKKDRVRRALEHRGEGVQELFIGLGPKGASITDEEIQKRLEAICPAKIVRRRDQCAFVEVQSRQDAEELIDKLHNEYIGEARISVQVAHEERKRERPHGSARDRPPRGRDYRGRFGDRREDRRRRSPRDDRYRRRRYSRSLSRSRSDSESSFEYRRHRRDDRRREAGGGRSGGPSRRRRSYSRSPSRSRSPRSLSSASSNRSGRRVDHRKSRR